MTHNLKRMMFIYVYSLFIHMHTHQKLLTQGLLSKNNFTVPQFSCRKVLCKETSLLLNCNQYIKIPSLFVNTSFYCFIMSRMFKNCDSMKIFFRIAQIFCLEDLWNLILSQNHYFLTASVTNLTRWRLPFV